MDYEQGYFWVLYEEEWHVAESDGNGNFYLCGDESCYLAEAFDNIDRKSITMEQEV